MLKNFNMIHYDVSHSTSQNMVMFMQAVTPESLTSNGKISICVLLT